MATDAFPRTEQSLDFFISYSPVDERWATWVAGTLEAAGYRTMLQVWDFVAGTNFIELMDRGVTGSAVVVAILSRNYLTSRYGRMEWQAALRAAPDRPETKLMTVRVEECDLSGLLATITYVDLVGVTDPEEARARLLDQVANTRPPAYIDPLRHPVGDADHKRALRRGDDAGRRQQQRRLRSPHGPLHFGVHPCAEPEVRVLHVEFNGHRAGFLVEIVRDEVRNAVERLAWIRRHGKRHSSALHHRANEHLRHGNDEAQA